VKRISAAELTAWACREIKDVKWLRVKDVLSKYLLENGGCSEDQAAELAEEQEGMILAALSKLNTQAIKQGTPVKFEIDNIYIKVTWSYNSDTKSKIDSLTGDEFEELCTALAKKLGANATKTGMKGDQGVDFMGENIAVGENFSLMPYNARPILYGQAKRYTGKVREPEVREFIAGALLRAKKHQNQNGLLCPVIYAFWTSSELDENAKKTCEEFGIWHMDGYGLSELCDQLKVEPEKFKKEST